VEKVQGGWTATGQPWTYDAERYERVAQARDREQQLMLDYQRTQTCRMAFLQHCLDDATAAPCGRCDVCAGVWYPTDIPADAVDLALGQLARVGVPVEPRAQWPTGMDRLGVPVRGKITPPETMGTGRALARLSDLGWGQRVRELVQGSDSVVPDQVVNAVTKVLADWDWSQRPVAIVSMPSRQRPQLVRSLATRISELGRLPYLGELTAANGGPAGESGGNSAFRLAAVWDQFEVGPELAEQLAGLRGPVLLIDDLVDSRWTMTVAARALRQAGAEQVLPLVLAQAG
jgi:ATP-dependent DNA helicase RecQ